MTGLATDYEIFEKSSAHNRRLLRQEQLILEVTEALSEVLANEGITKAELANRLNKTKGFVSQILAGGRNLTLRTIADVADALGCKIRVQAVKEAPMKEAAAKSLLAWSEYEDLAWPLGHEAEIARPVPAVHTRELVGYMWGAA